VAEEREREAKEIGQVIQGTTANGHLLIDRVPSTWRNTTNLVITPMLAEGHADRIVEGVGIISAGGLAMMARIRPAVGRIPRCRLQARLRRKKLLIRTR
jgi:hypothetical protein